MLDIRCARAYAAGGVTVLGTQLGVFSLWHCFQLDLIRSPLFTGEGDTTFEDLAIAVRVCATPVMGRPDFSLPEFWARCRLQRYRRHFKAERDRFAEWLADHLSGPDCWEGEDSGPIKSPWQLYLVARLVLAPPGLSMSEVAAWSTSPAVARWRLASIFEAQGGDPKIITEVEREALEQADAEVPNTDGEASQDGE